MLNEAYGYCIEEGYADGLILVLAFECSPLLPSFPEAALHRPQLAAERLASLPHGWARDVGLGALDLLDSNTAVLLATHVPGSWLADEVSWRLDTSTGACPPAKRQRLTKIK